MILKNTRELSEGFYNYLLKNCRAKSGQANRVLILTAHDVDAVCAVKILLHLFHCDHIQYVLSVCTKKQDCLEAAQSVGDTVKCVLMVNCGAGEDVAGLFGLGEKIRFFILDSRLPVHLRNLYSARQVVVLRKMNADSIPPFDDIFRDGMEDVINENGEFGDENEDALSQYSDDSQDDRRLHVREARKKERELRKWNTARIAIEKKYYKEVYYQDSSAVRMFELAHLVSKDDQDLFFWAVIGLCDMFMQRKIGSAEFVEKSVALQGHVIRLSHSSDISNQQNFRITYGQDLALRFYRQWSIFESLCNSPYTVAIFRVWETRGHAKLHEFLADMGLALAQCKQTYSAMDYAVRRDMMEWFQSQAPEWNVPDLISGGCFIATYGFNQKFQINDMSLGLFACLTVNSHQPLEDNFHDALDTLAKLEFQRIEQALLMGRDQLIEFRKIVQSAFEEKRFTGMTNYVQISLDAISTGGTKFAARPHILAPLAHFLQEAYVVMAKTPRIKKVPFVLVAQLQPPSAEGEEDFLHLMGLPSWENVEGGQRNFMGPAFVEAGQRAKVELVWDTFEEGLVRIRKRERTAFLDALIIVLTHAGTGGQ